MKQITMAMSLDRTTKNFAIYSSKEKAILYMPIEQIDGSAPQRISIVAAEASDAAS